MSGRVEGLRRLAAARARKHAGLYAGAAFSGLGVGIGVAANREDGLTGLAPVFATAGLVLGLWIARRAVEMEDRRERRTALHATLPIPRSALALFQVLEPALVALAALVLGLAGFWILPRLAGLGPLPASVETPGADDLRFLLGLVAWFLVVELFTTAWNEVRVRIADRALGKVAFLLVPLAFGLGVGFLAGKLAHEDGLTPELFRLLLASEWSFAAATTVFCFSVAFAIPLFHQRQSYVSG